MPTIEFYELPSHRSSRQVQVADQRLLRFDERGKLIHECAPGIRLAYCGRESRNLPLHLTDTPSLAYSVAVSSCASWP